MTTDKTMIALTALAGQRRDAWQAQQAARAAVTTSVLAAAGAGADTADIARIAAEPYSKSLSGTSVSALTRQGAHKILKDKTDQIPATWRDTGEPTPSAALATLSEAVSAAIPRISAYEHARDETVAAMWRARDAGNGAAAVADASGFASATAYDYLKLAEDWKAITTALADLLEERTPEDLSRIGVAHHGKLLWVRNLWASRDVQRRMEAALKSVGMEPAFTKPRYWNLWIPVRRIAQNA